jgi:hypothetical protein
MDMKRRCSRTLLGGIIVLALGACASRFEPAELQGPPVMVKGDGHSRLWVMTRLEEVRPRLRRGARRLRILGNDTFFHFEVQAFDPVTARPVWTRRVLSIGDVEAGAVPSRVIGSASEGRLLGTDDEMVWLLVDDRPMALAMADGSLVADRDAVEQRNPALKGLLPTDAKHYGFDRGLVFMSADAQHFVVRGRGLRAEPYTPPVVSVPVDRRRPNGTLENVPLRPPFEVPARQVWLEEQWLGLYTEKEALDAEADQSGQHLRYPYDILDEGALARRRFWRADIVEFVDYEERLERIDALVPVPDSPVFLKGRFLENPVSGEPLVLAAPAGVMVWHNTRIDSDGRLALTRLDSGLRMRWTAELPLTEAGFANPVDYWLLPDRIVVTGRMAWNVDGVSRRDAHLVSVSLVDGSQAAWDLQGGTALP